MDYLGVQLKIVQGDALSYSSDLLVLKYAQKSYGLDRRAVNVAGVDATTLPLVGASLLVQKPSGMASSNLLFLGVEPIAAFSYRSIRDFSRRALASAARISPPVRGISMTLHGIGFGLDELEAFESEVAGVVEALDSDEYPKSLVTVSIIERDNGRVDRMRGALMTLLSPEESSERSAEPNITGGKPRPRRLDSVGYDSAARPHAFVAMPFAESYEDIFHFGIAPPIRAVGFLCERIDQISFTGDVIDRMRERIASSVVVVADLSGANPNVYLEIGYAWGVRTPCVLICHRETDPKFDVRGQHCLFYGSIRELETILSAELTALFRR